MHFIFVAFYAFVFKLSCFNFQSQNILKNARARVCVCGAKIYVNCTPCSKGMILHTMLQRDNDLDAFSDFAAVVCKSARSLISSSLAIALKLFCRNMEQRVSLCRLHQSLCATTESFINYLRE